VETGEFACFDALPKDFSKIILQDFELHGPEYSTGESPAAKGRSFPQVGLVYPTLTEKIHSYRIAATKRPLALQG
jgi:hypothetical protein